MLLFFVAAVNRLAHWTTNGTTHILATMVVTEHVTAAHAVRHQTLLILAFGNVLPQSLHPGAVRRHGTPTVFVLALGGMAQQEKPLLLMP